MIDKLEHGWIVDGIPACDDCRTIYHCHCCWKKFEEPDDLQYLGLGKYICKECYDEQIKQLEEY
jgi:hypothetical protein